MSLAFALERNGGLLTICRGRYELPVRESGYTRSVHREGREIALMGRIASCLNEAGFQVCRARLSEDGHLLGHEWSPYVRTKRRATKDAPSLYIFDSSWAMRSLGNRFNEYKSCILSVLGDILPERPQPDWKDRVIACCAGSDIECVCAS
jgi:hypothetical protein